MKKIRILIPARKDLIDGFRFYENQAEGIGRYFLDVAVNPQMFKIARMRQNYEKARSIKMS